MLCTYRYYDPTRGRWLTRDPIGYGGGLNLYGYCGGDAVGGVDALGLVVAEVTAAGEIADWTHSIPDDFRPRSRGLAIDSVTANPVEAAEALRDMTVPWLTAGTAGALAQGPAGEPAGQAAWTHPSSTKRKPPQEGPRLWRGTGKPHPKAGDFVPRAGHDEDGLSFYSSPGRVWQNSNKGHAVGIEIELLAPGFAIRPDPADPTHFMLVPLVGGEKRMRQWIETGSSDAHSQELARLAKTGRRASRPPGF